MPKQHKSTSDWTHLTPLAAHAPLVHNRDAVPRGAWGMLLFAPVLAAVLTCFSLVLPHFLALKSPPGSAIAWFSQPAVAGLAIAAVLATLVAARSERHRFRDYGLRSAHPVRNLLGGALSGLLLLSALLMLLHQLNLLVFRGQVLFGAAAQWQLSLQWLAAFLIGAFAQQIAWNGYPQYALTRGFATFLRKRLPVNRSAAAAFWSYAAVLCCTVACLTWVHSNRNPIAVCNNAAFSLLMSLSLWRTGSLWWAVGFQAAWEWSQSFLWGVHSSGTAVRDHLFLTETTGSTLRSGGSNGPEGSLYMPGALLAAVGILMLLRPRRPYPELWQEAAGTPADNVR